MDPWLENPTVWRGCHDTLVVKSVELLQPLLRQRGYYIDVGERVWIVEDERSIWPDNVLFRRHRGGEHSATAAGTLVADEPVRIGRPVEEMRETFAEIYVAVSHELVTCIEFLSHTNKQSSQGRELYQQKQEELDRAGVHLVEIDLLRAGPHMLAVPESVVAQLKPWDYLVNLERRESREYEVYPIRLRDPLPKIRVPLKAGDEDAVLDLQELLSRAYDIGPYPERLSYEQPPTPPLREEDATWADELLRAHGLRQ